MRQRTSGLTTGEVSPAKRARMSEGCAPRAVDVHRAPAFVARFACVLLLALTSTALPRPVILTSPASTASDPVPSNRGKVVERSAVRSSRRTMR